MDTEDVNMSPKQASFQYNRPIKRVKIEKLFENLTLEDRSKVRSLYFC